MVFEGHKSWQSRGKGLIDGFDRVSVLEKPFNGLSKGLVNCFPRFLKAFEDLSKAFQGHLDGIRLVNPSRRPLKAFGKAFG